MTNLTPGKLPRNTLLTIGSGTQWGGIFIGYEVKRVFKNGKAAVRVGFHGGSKVFHLDIPDVLIAIRKATAHLREE